MSKIIQVFSFEDKLFGLDVDGVLWFYAEYNSFRKESIPRHWRKVLESPEDSNSKSEEEK